MRWLWLGVLLGCLAFPVTAQTADDLDRKALIEELDRAPTEEQLTRKARSMDLLRGQGIPVLDSLPVIADEARSTRRSDREVAGRALALMIVALKGETGDQGLVDTVVAQYSADPFFTPAERAFLDDPNPPEQMRVQMTWRYESVYALLWALGFYGELSPPDQLVDAGVLGTLFNQLGTAGLMETAKFRPQSELLDMADLVYRMD